MAEDTTRSPDPTVENQERDNHHSDNARLPITNTSPQGYIMTLHTCILALNGVLGVCIQVKFPDVSPYDTADGTLMMNLFIIEICFYIISLVVMGIQALEGEGLMNNISLFLGTLSLILELLVLISPFGWIALFFWSICLLCFLISKSSKSLNTHLGCAYQKLKDLIIRNVGRVTEHEGQNQNQNQTTEAPV